MSNKGGLCAIDGAVALRPVVADHKRNRFISYSATTFRGNARAGCDAALRSLSALGFISTAFPDNTALPEEIILDVLDVTGGIIQDFSMTREGLRFLRREWGIGPQRIPEAFR